MTDEDKAKELKVTVHDEDDGNVYELSAHPETLVRDVIRELYKDHLDRDRRPDDRLRCEANGDDVFAHEDETLRRYEETHCRELIWVFTGGQGGA